MAAPCVECRVAVTKKELLGAAARHPVVADPAADEEHQVAFTGCANDLVPVDDVESAAAIDQHVERVQVGVAGDERERAPAHASG